VRANGRNLKQSIDDDCVAGRGWEGMAARIVVGDATGGSGVLATLRLNFCREHVAQLRSHEQEFRAKGAALAAVSLGDAQYAKVFREETGITFPLLIDEKKKAYEAIELRSANLLHLLRRDNSAALRTSPRRGATVNTSWAGIRFS